LKSGPTERKRTTKNRGGLYRLEVEGRRRRSTRGRKGRGRGERGRGGRGPPPTF